MINQPNQPTDGNGQNQGADATDVRQDQLEDAYFGADNAETASSSSVSNGITPPGSPMNEEQADELVEALHSKFMHLLKGKLDANDGQLSDGDVEQMGTEFKGALDEMKTAFLGAVETSTLSRKHNRVEKTRNNLFQRLMVKNFEASFTDEKNLEAHPEMLSRRMLPGFFAMLLLMFGKSRLAEYEQQAGEIVDGIRQTQGDSFVWGDVYTSLAARKLVLRAEIEIAEYFREYDKRLIWMIAVINSNLIPLDANMMPLDENRNRTPWVFRKQAATHFLSSLFHDLDGALKKQSVRDNFVERLGSKTVEDLDNVLLKLN